jgi:hypothetical protein
MGMSYYVDAEGNYLGGFTKDNPATPSDAVRVSEPPTHGWQIWSNSAWLPLTPEQSALIGT